jgi:hypothetical protein
LHEAVIGSRVDAAAAATAVEGEAAILGGRPPLTLAKPEKMSTAALGVERILPTDSVEKLPAKSDLVFVQLAR